MTSARSLVTSILGALLSAAPLICAPEAKPSEASVIPQSRPVIQELELQPQRLLNLLSLAWAPLIYAHDLSRYREFQFGMNLLAVANQAGMEPSEAKVIHQRPAIIQELSWQPPWQPQGFPGSSLDADSVKEVLFSFYNGELFRMVVSYDGYKTARLTAADMTEALSATYGTALNPAAEIILCSTYDDNETVKVIARWEDSKHSFNLVRSSYPFYQPSFALVVLSKGLDALAQAATTEALRLDQQEAPQR